MLPGKQPALTKDLEDKLSARLQKTIDLSNAIKRTG